MKFIDLNWSSLKMNCHSLAEFLVSLFIFLCYILTLDYYFHYNYSKYFFVNL